MNTILLIDDDPVILSVFGQALRKAGYRVFEAETGLTGFELALRELPDVIITDIAMPGGGGEALLHHIRENPELCHRQVVFMTGQVDKISPRQGMEAGADDFLVKPVSLAALLHCVEARLKRAHVHWRVEDQMLTQLRTSLHSNLPHEFFTPLGGILGLTEILRADLERMPGHEVKDLLADIHHSALRLHRTLRNYLSVLELRENEPTQLPGPLAPREVEDSIWSGVKSAVRRHRRKEDVTVKLDASPILAGASDLSVVVEELIDNACSYSRRGTPIYVELDRKSVLTITDAGRGMSAEELHRIGPFHQFERKKHEQQGLGLGLMLVHKLVGRCGAKPVIESQPGQGTRVRIAFMTPLNTARLEAES
jgi:two-component system sensor histidine kinase/response regulator